MVSSRGPNWMVYAISQNVCSLRAVFRSGAIYEPPHLAGMSHLLEHVLFKTRGARLDQRMDALGARYNAATGKEYTVFEVTVPAEHALDAVRVLHDVTLRFDVSLRELQTEKDIVLQERAARASPLASLLTDTALGGTPYEKSVIGVERTVRAVSLDDLRAYHAERYVRNGGIVLGACPGECLAAVAGRVRALFGHLVPPTQGVVYDFLAGRAAFLEFADEGAARCKSCRLTMFPRPNAGGADAGCAVVFRGFPYDRRRTQILDFVLHALGGNPDAGWFGALREKARSVYTPSLSRDDTYANAGLVTLRFTSTNPILRVFDAVRRMVLATLRRGVAPGGAREFRALRDAYKAKLQVDLASSLSAALDWGAVDAVYAGADEGGCRFSQPDERIQAVDGFTLAETNDILRSFVANPLLVLLGNNDRDTCEAAFQKAARRAVLRFVSEISRGAKNALHRARSASESSEASEASEAVAGVLRENQPHPSSDTHMVTAEISVQARNEKST